MRLFRLGEEWGPVRCEEIMPNGDRCGELSWCIELTDEENASLPESTGPRAMLSIYDRHLGKVLCHKHGGF